LMTNYSDLEQKAKDATEGPWYDDSYKITCARDPSKPYMTYSNYRDDVVDCNLEYIAAANPQVILKLIARLRVLEEVASAGEILREFLDEEIGMDKTELTMLRRALTKLEELDD